MGRGGLTVHGGGILNGVAIGIDPPPAAGGDVKFPWPHETIGTANPQHNLRLHSNNVIAFHTGNAQAATAEIDSVGNLTVSGIRIRGELPFHYATFIAKFGERSIDTRWEVTKYVVIVAGFDFSRPGIQAYIDRSGPTSQIKYNSQSAGSDGAIYVLRIRKELVSGL